MTGREPDPPFDDEPPPGTTADVVNALMPHMNPKTVLDGRLAVFNAVVADIQIGEAAVVTNKRKLAELGESIVVDLFLSMDWVFRSSSNEYGRLTAEYTTTDGRFKTLETVLEAIKAVRKSVSWIDTRFHGVARLTLAELPPEVATVAKSSLVKLRDETATKLKVTENEVKTKAAEIIQLREVLARLS